MRERREMRRDALLAWQTVALGGQKRLPPLQGYLKRFEDTPAAAPGGGKGPVAQNLLGALMQVQAMRERRLAAGLPDDDTQS